MGRQLSVVGMHARLPMAMALLLACKCVAAADCGTTLQAAELGRLANTLSQVNRRLLKTAADLDSCAARGGEASCVTRDAQRLYAVVVPAMQVQSAVDRLAVLTQLRDLMLGPEDRTAVRGAIASFAASAADASASALARLGADAASPDPSGPGAEVQRVRGVLRRIAALLSICGWPAR